MAGEWCQRDCFIILRANGENDSALGQLMRVFLKGDKGFARRAALAKNQAFHTVVPDDAAPKRIIQIQDQAFVRPSALGRDDARHQIAV